MASLMRASLRRCVIPLARHADVGSRTRVMLAVTIENMCGVTVVSFRHGE
jgi:hypothetical protein